MNETIRADYWVAESNVEALEKEVARLARKAVKLGVTPPTLIVVPSETRQAEYVARYEVTAESAPEEAPVMVGYTQVRVTLEGEAPALDGWQWIATIDHLTDLPDNANLVEVGDVADAVTYENVPANCEHCGYKRNRKWTYILEKGGERTQVGRTCLRDFIPGSNDPHKIADYAQLIRVLVCGLSDDCGDMWGEPMGPHRTDAVLTSGYLQWVVASIRADGWLSRGAAWDRYGDSNRSTANRAWDNMGDTGGFRETPEAREARLEREPTAKDKQKASDALTWALEDLDGESGKDYLDNLYMSLQPSSVTHKRIGLVASVVTAFERAEARKAREAALPKSTHFGVLKQRYDLTGEVVFTTWIDSDWGSTLLLKFRDAEGHLFVWFASNVHVTPKRGSTISVRATVRKHDTYNGEQQTVVTRGKLQEAIT